MYFLELSHAPPAFGHHDGKHHSRRNRPSKKSNQTTGSNKKTDGNWGENCPKPWEDHLFE